MSQNLKPRKVPTWRVLLYGLFTTAVVAGMGIHFHERAFIIGAVFAGFFIVGLGLIPNWLATKPGAVLWTKKNIGWMIAVVMLLNVLLYLIDLLSKLHK